MAQKLAFDGYADTLKTFSSDEARTTLDAAIKMMDAAQINDADTFSEAADAHEKALKSLPSEELDKIYDYLGAPKN